MAKPQSLIRGEAHLVSPWFSNQWSLVNMGTEIARLRSFPRSTRNRRSARRRHRVDTGARRIRCCQSGRHARRRSRPYHQALVVGPPLGRHRAGLQLRARQPPCPPPLDRRGGRLAGRRDQGLARFIQHGHDRRATVITNRCRSLGLARDRQTVGSRCSAPRPHSPHSNRRHGSDVGHRRFAPALDAVRPNRLDWLA